MCMRRLIQNKMLDNFYRDIYRLHQQAGQKEGGNVSKIVGNEQNLNTRNTNIDNRFVAVQDFQRDETENVRS